MITPLDRLDPMTLHGLVRAFMAAYFEDAIDAKKAVVTGNEWPTGDTRGKALERSVCTMSQCIEQAMETGELSPFSGDYIKWLEKLGLISPRQKDVPNAKG